MAKSGPKPETDEKKRLKGETRPSRLAAAQSGGPVVVAFPVIDRVPEPPEWLADDGKDLWRELAPMLYGQKVLTKADLPMLSHLCQLHSDILKSIRAGIPPSGSDRAQLRLYFAEFGCSPSSRTRVPHGSKEGGNRFGNNGERQGKA